MAEISKEDASAPRLGEEQAVPGEKGSGTTVHPLIDRTELGRNFGHVAPIIRLFFQEHHRSTWYWIASVSQCLQTALELVWGGLMTKREYDRGKRRVHPQIHNFWQNPNIFLIAGAINFGVIASYAFSRLRFERRSFEPNDIRVKQYQAKKHYTANLTGLILTIVSLLAFDELELESAHYSQGPTFRHDVLPPLAFFWLLVSLIFIGVLSNAATFVITYTMHKQGPRAVPKYRIPSWIIWQKAFQRLWRGDGFFLY